ncbi:hypothetical protein [Bradyrhizobium sp.]|uniref:hypothetical protein n=1 Tax=Bradyrhizobium sp. TaxID=376 RepID=UPI001DF310FD|nr:hypothetical protein [Bradyrhizobium sp.]MBI5320402.1 hypothetical protein [Bradyrhizobium sp.]
MDEDILTEEELKRAVQKIFRLSQTDPEFRALCLGNPNEAIQRITGKAVAPGVKIQFLDSAADKAKDPGGAAK